jgi:hypothetical protein
MAKRKRNKTTSNMIAAFRRDGTDTTWLKHHRDMHSISTNSRRETRGFAKKAGEDAAKDSKAGYPKAAFYSREYERSNRDSSNKSSVRMLANRQLARGWIAEIRGERESKADKYSRTQSNRNSSNRKKAIKHFVGKMLKVVGYTRKDGTTVKAHKRKS